MNSLGIFAAPGKARARGLVLQLVALCEAAKIPVCLPISWARQIERPELGAPDETVASRDALVVFSGDGGILAAARAAAPFGTPILGVDLGRLGFLSSVRPEELESAFHMLREGAFETEERLMLNARVLRRRESMEGQGTPCEIGPRSIIGANYCEVGGSLGLNDAVVAKSALARILRLNIYVEGELVAAVRADGLVISTPTGSTAYALSAGGPIVHPGVPLLLMCPICAHTLMLRPLVVGPDETVEILAEWEGDEVAPGQLHAMLTVDGQIGFELKSGDIVRVRRDPTVARLLVAPGDGFYSRLRQKLRWGD
ncbi:MAG TPA: NAD(+)/NADH kinase [Abditibacteriaceae bacterium]|jgi:NAD+ kinase